jgi:hypothetical protein
MCLCPAGEGAISASLMPRLWPKLVLEYALEAAELIVLVRLGTKELEYVEYADELVDAFESWRRGLEVDVE